MTTKDLLYYFSILYNAIYQFYCAGLQYVSETSQRINRVFIGNDNLWILPRSIANIKCVRKDDLISVNMPQIKGYLYNTNTNYFHELDESTLTKQVEKLPYLGGEYRYTNGDTNAVHDITEWMSQQNYRGATPTTMDILVAWAVKTNNLGLLCMNSSSKLILIDMLGDEIILNLEKA